ncbi:Acetyl esterase/lipase [Filimonas lacunae]|uniref:Acetyl esterase/lipase n=2 Tax=Filimonas lacunae TaxID=477680 RepID=A0A173MPY4_9BACT|nr:esterase/lipase [Filimonas lacunae]SIS73212.1 Acetyl esterase/lipase [Filimonas lacunae]
MLIAVVLLLLSLLVVVKAPTHFLWQLSVVVTCYPYVFMLLSAVVATWAFTGGKCHLVALCMNGMAFCLYALPIANACYAGKGIADALTAVFPDKQLNATKAQPFSGIRMFTGLSITPVSASTIVYANAGDKVLTFDYYPSYTKEPSPVVIVIHGGSWESGDSKQLPALNSFLANRGYNVAAINYRLAPQYQFPAPVEDTRKVIAYIKKQAAVLHADTNNIVLLGRSAGGQVALVAAYSLPDNSIKGVVDLYAPADMVWGGRVKVSDWVLNTNSIYKGYFGGVYTQVPEVFKKASACEYVNRKSPPTLLIHGDIDPLVSSVHSVHLSNRLTACGVRNYFLRMPYATHGCDYNINSPAGQLTAYAVEHFIHSVTQ